LRELKILSEPLTTAEMLATLALKGERVDQYTKVANSTKVVEGTKFKMYNWGKNNMLPVEMLEVAQSNGTVLNLLGLRKDFMYGAGLGLFKYDEALDKDIELTKHAKVKSAFIATDINAVIRKVISSYIDVATAPINVSVEGGNISLMALDPLNVRVAQVELLDSVAKVCLISPNFRDSKAKVVAVPYFDRAVEQKESIHIFKPNQTGQFYYGYADWWSAIEWIKIDNKISAFYNDSLASEGNLGHIIRVSDDMLDGMASALGTNTTTQEDWTRDQVKPIFEEAMNNFLFEAAKKKKIVDYCGVMQNGTLAHGLEIEPIKKSITGDEYTKLQTVALNYIIGSFQMLGGMAGISNGSMNSGGGTEIRVSAEFQQYFRTARDRDQILDFLNAVFLPTFKKLAGIAEGENVFFQFKNIHLQTLDENKKEPIQQKAIV
jgi:hypothetical protein